MNPVYVAVDTETTGFDRSRDATITQVAGVAIDSTTGAFLSQGTLRIKITPEQITAFTKEAKDVQGWTPELNELGQPLDICRQQFHAWLSGFPDILGYVAHAARFDRIFFDRCGLHAVERPWYCTKTGMHALEKKTGAKFDNHKLSSLATACGYTQRDAHQALDDVLACANGFLWLKSRGVQDREMLISTVVN
jgi:DNA polymerase III epsilon subunit-like protein